MGWSPLVTFALISYNAEQFVGAAVEGALAQSYSPLEIILSDDCSKDATFSIMEELAGKYNGENRVRLNRNEVNLGLGEHINKIMQLAQGEYIIIAAGDDISTTERAVEIIKKFEAGGKRIMAVFSDWIEIDGKGEDQKIVSAEPPAGFTELPLMCRHMFRGIPGATNAWHRSVFDVFGPMQKNIVFEDRVIAFRAALLGEIAHSALPLVRYRRHETNTVEMFHVTSFAAMRKRLACFRDVYINNIIDLNTFFASGNLNPKVFAKCMSIMKRELRKLNGYLRLLDGGIIAIFSGLVQVVINGGNPFPLVWQCICSLKKGRN